MPDYSKETYEMVKRLEAKSLTNTKPYCITDTNTYSDLNGYAVYAIEDTTFDSSTVFGISGNTITGKTLLAGHVWYVPVITVKLASGSVLVYRHDN